MAEWLRRLTRNQIPSGSVGSSPTDRERKHFFKIFVKCQAEPHFCRIEYRQKKDDPLIQQTTNFVSLKFPDIELLRQSKEIVAEDMRNLTF